MKSDKVLSKKSPSQLRSLPVEVIVILRSRLADEYSAYALYKKASNWCNSMGYKVAAKFFNKEAANELSHAQEIMDFAADWGEVLDIKMRAELPSFDGLVDIINKAYEQELNLLDSYSINSKRLFDLHQGSYQLMKKFVDYQMEEVSEYATIVGALSLVDTDRKLDLLFFEKTYLK